MITNCGYKQSESSIVLFRVDVMIFYGIDRIIIFQDERIYVDNDYYDDMQKINWSNIVKKFMRNYRIAY